MVWERAKGVVIALEEILAGWLVMELIACRSPCSWSSLRPLKVAQAAQQRNNFMATHLEAVNKHEQYRLLHIDIVISVS
jgi:hypothetical protein